MIEVAKRYSHLYEPKNNDVTEERDEDLRDLYCSPSTGKGSEMKDSDSDSDKFGSTQ
jgi:hypothetical protein